MDGIVRKYGIWYVLYVSFIFVFAIFHTNRFAPVIIITIHWNGLI